MSAKIILTRTATRSRRRPGNGHVISIRQVSPPTRPRYAAAAASLPLNADAGALDSLIIKK